MVVVLTLVVAGLLAAPAEPAAPPAPIPGPGHGPAAGVFDVQKWVEHLAVELDATPAQVKQLAAIAEEHAAAAEAARAKHRAAREEHADELKALREQMREARKAKDRERVGELHDQMRELMGGGDRVDLMEQTHEKIAALLTDEQRAKFEQIVERQRERFGDRRGWRGRDGDGPRRGERGPGAILRFTDRVIEVVEATEEQKTQLKAIAAEHIRAAKSAEADKAIAMAENAEELKALRKQLRDAHKAGDEEAVKAAKEKIRALMGSSPQELLESTHEKMTAVLTDEQKPKFEALVKEVRERAERGFKEGKGRHGKMRDRKPKAEEPDA